ncbi:MAG TPA: histidine kinase [Gemmatimonadales bacterium]|nr:histidine kinase [Gemmatimonadales bacterium]
MAAFPTSGVADIAPATAIPLLPGRERIGWILALGGWTLVGLGYFASLAFQTRTPQDTPSTEWPRLLVYAVGTGWIWAALTPPVLWLTRPADFAAGQRSRSIALYALTGALFFLGSGACVWLLGMATGLATSNQFWSVLLVEEAETRLLAFLAIVTLGWSARYFALYRSRHLHASDLETRLAKTHLQVLKMQLQPHFLFNTLNTIAELVHTDPVAADQMITRLGRLLRLSLDHASHQVVPLRQEADFLRVYLAIEQVRFQDRLQIVWDLAPETLDAAIPTLLWQPVLENAIRHGVTPLGGRGQVVISSRREAEDLVLEIRDNGQGLPPGGLPREGVGLRNVRQRMDQLYGPRARFTLAPALGGGTVATLRIPFLHCDVPHTPVPLPRGDVEELVQ